MEEFVVVDFVSLRKKTCLGSRSEKGFLLERQRKQCFLSLKDMRDTSN